MAHMAEEGMVAVGQTMADTVGILLALADNSQRDTGFLVNQNLLVCIYLLIKKGRGMGFE